MICLVPPVTTLDGVLANQGIDQYQFRGVCQVLSPVGLAQILEGLGIFMDIR